MISLINEQSPLPEYHAQENVDFKCNVSKEEYCNMIEKTKAYIREGDIFQGVISRRFEAEYNSSLMNAYRVLRTTNPSPYMYFIQSEAVSYTHLILLQTLQIKKGKICSNE